MDDIVAAARGPAHSRGAVLSGARPRSGRSCRSATRRRSRRPNRQVFYRETGASRRGIATDLWASLAPQALRRSSGQRRAHPLEPLGRGGPALAHVRSASPYGVRRAGLSLHRRRPRPSAALLALHVSSVNSYRRLQPHFWSSAYTAWAARQSRGGGAGAVDLSLRSRRLDICRAQGVGFLVESLPAALGGCSRPGLDGVTRCSSRASPSSSTPAPCPSVSGGSAGAIVTRYSWARSLEQLERDGVLMSALGPTLARAYLAVKALGGGGVRTRGRGVRDQAPFLESF
jgi:glutamine synthetase